MNSARPGMLAGDQFFTLSHMVLRGTLSCSFRSVLRPRLPVMNSFYELSIGVAQERHMCIMAQMSKCLKRIFGTIVIASIAGATTADIRRTVRLPTVPTAGGDCST
jgi:hypothetical protein